MAQVGVVQVGGGGDDLGATQSEELNNVDDSDEIRQNLKK